jgi:nucleotide-binding universal stress UspA family protein
MIRLNRILVATDFGSASETALNYGRAIGAALGGALHVLHVTENVYLAASSGYGQAYVPPEVQRDIERAAKEQTEALLTQEDRDTLQAQAVTVTFNTPAAAIVEYARANAVDLIIVGTHGRGAFSHLFMGSVAERVVRTATCPVLTVRNPEHEFVVPDALVAVSKS